ncbi:MAG: FAD-dependent oxidoreductase [Shinella sp.]|uniref:FAD-dependent oxidoreductase n=1 Tax=Shinella sp. TaxID=1870904 RepID=UPI0040375C22
MKESHFDVAIIGGGINGASAAQHLSAAGYSVPLVGQGNFANGATSRSSRLCIAGCGTWRQVRAFGRLSFSPAVFQRT